MATIKLQTNIPVTGTIGYCDFIPTKTPGYSDQISLQGKWDGAGDGRMYLHLAVEQDLQKLGIIGQRAQNGNYPLRLKEPKVKIAKVEQGASKRTIVELISHAGEIDQQVQNYAAPQQTQQTRQGSLYNPPATSAPPAPPEVSLEDLEKTYQDCLRVASKIWLGKAEAGKDYAECIGETASALFAQRCRLGLYGLTADVPF